MDSGICRLLFGWRTRGAGSGVRAFQDLVRRGRTRNADLRPFPAFVAKIVQTLLDLSVPSRELGGGEARPVDGEEERSQVAIPGFPANPALSPSSSLDVVDSGGLDTAVLQRSAKHRAMSGDLTVFDVLDPREMSTSAQGVSFARRLQDRDLMRVRFDKPISRFTGRIFGGIATSTCEDRFATEVDVGGDAAYFAFYALLHGRTSLIQHGHETIGAGSDGLVFRFTPGTRLLTSDLTVREILYIEVSALEHALEGLLDNRLRERLAFKPGIDWNSGLAASLRGQIDFLIGEMERRGGVADSPVALAFLTDLVVSLVLRGVAHNYLDRLGSGRSGVAPAYVRRADEFMRAHAV